MSEMLYDNCPTVTGKCEVYFRAVPEFVVGRGWKALYF
jgi:hypothetical protein